MPGILSQSATIQCMHGGMVTVIPKPHPLLLAGVPALLATDLIGCPIVGCPVPPPIAGPGPCLSVAAPPANWASPLALHMGMPLLSYMPGVPGGLTAGGAPAPLICTSPGQTLVA